MSASSLLKKYRRRANYLLVGVTGHRDLLLSEKANIQVKVRAKLNKLRDENPQKDILLLSAMAPGADQWVAQCLGTQDLLVVVQTMPNADAQKDTFVDDDTAYEYFLNPRVPHERITLYQEPQESNSSGQPTALTTAQRQAQYVKLGEFLVEHCDHLLALWDGVDGGGLGGTSDIVRMWIKGKGLNGREVRRKQTAQTLHQLVLSRKQNYFPVGRRFEGGQKHLPVGEKYSWVCTAKPNPAQPKPAVKLLEWASRHFSWLTVGGLLFGLLIVVDIITGFKMKDLITLSGLMVAYGSAWWVYNRYPFARTILLRFVYPIVIASLILILGTIGFLNSEACLSWGDSFFSAANLITLNNSVFSSIENKAFKSNVVLEIARILGGFLAGYAFILAFSLAVGKEGLSRVQFWWFRFRSKFWQREFTVVIGDGEMALDAVLDLERQKKRVVMMDEGRHPKVEELLKTHRVWYFKGNLTSHTSLQKTYYKQAKEVFVMCEADEENARIVQEMDNTNVEKRQWYVHLHDLRLRGLMHQLLRKSSGGQVRTFSVYENTARRLLTRYPVDRFGEGQKGVQIILLGFGKLAQEIALTCLRLGSYTQGRYLMVKVYYPAGEQPLVDEFRAGHPELFRGAGQFISVGPAQKAQNYTFYEHLPMGENPVTFEVLPAAESELRSAKFSLYDLIEPRHSVSVYACMATGIESVRVLGALLPRIQWIKQNKDGLETAQTDVQIFCHYNFPDQDEEEYLETRLNALAPYLPVFCFGNFIQECSVEAIRNEQMDQIARRLALVYACLYSTESVDSENEVIHSFSQEADAFVTRYVQFATRFHPLEKERFEAKGYNWAKIKQSQQLLGYFEHLPEARLRNYLNKVWQHISEDERESNIQAADHAWVKLREMGRSYADTEHSAGFWSEEELEVLGELEHRRWNAEKLTLAWLPYGNAALWKDNKKAIKAQKYHYFLVPFYALPPEEQNKDHTQVLGLPYFFKDIMKWPGQT